MQVFGSTDEGRPGSQAGSGRMRRILTAATLGVYVLIGIATAVHTHNRIGPGGAPLFYDFSAFYQAGALADSGKAASAYDDNTMIAAERSAFPGATVRLPWNYPPTYQLLLMPLAALPYVVAWLLWSGSIYALYVLLARKLVDPRHLWLLLLAPGAAVNLFISQNGLLSTVLIGGGVLVLGRRPLLGGLLLGLMAYKPPLAVLVPLALAFGREWRALGAMLASGVVFALIALAILGIDPWLAFLHKVAQPEAIFSSSSSDWRSIPSVLIMARTLGLDARLGAALHWVVAAAAVVGALWVWRRGTDPRLRAAALATATVLVTPYLRLYDLALLILPVAALLPGGDGEAGLVERAAIFAAWILPAALMLTPGWIQFGPLVAIAVMVLIVRGAARPLPPAAFVPAGALKA